MLQSLILSSCLLLGQAPQPHPFADAVNNLAEQIEVTREAQERKERADKAVEFAFIGAIGLLGAGILVMAFRGRRY